MSTPQAAEGGGFEKALCLLFGPVFPFTPQRPSSGATHTRCTMPPRLRPFSASQPAARAGKSALKNPFQAQQCFNIVIALL